MRILDKYVITELLGPFFFGICAFSSVFVGSSTLLRIAQYVTTYGAGFSSVVKLFIYSLPSIIVLTFPMSMLLATLLAFGRMSSSSEITAMKSSGISFYRLTAPVYIIAIIVSIFAIGFNEYVVPKANEAYTKVVEYEIKGNTAPKSQEHIVIKDMQGGNIERLTYARRYEEASATMTGVSIQEFDKDKLVRMQNAEKALWNNAGYWIMYNGSVHDLSEEGNVQRTLRFTQQVLPINKKPQEISREQKKPDEMTMKELRKQIRIMKSQFVDVKKMEVEYYQRITIPFASLVFALIGTPLGLQPHRNSSSIGFGISIIVIFIYYAIMTILSALGQGGSLAPVVAAWLPNIIGIIVGLYLIRKAAR